MQTGDNPLDPLGGHGWMSQSSSLRRQLGTDPDKTQVEVQNHVDQVLPKLPDEVRELGVMTTKQSRICKTA